MSFESAQLREATEKYTNHDPSTQGLSETRIGTEKQISHS